MDDDGNYDSSKILQEQHVNIDDILNAPSLSISLKTATEEIKDPQEKIVSILLWLYMIIVIQINICTAESH